MGMFVWNDYKVLHRIYFPVYIFGMWNGHTNRVSGGKQKRKIATMRIKMR